MSENSIEELIEKLRKGNTRVSEDRARRRVIESGWDPHKAVNRARLSKSEIGKLGSAVSPWRHNLFLNNTPAEYREAEVQRLKAERERVAQEKMNNTYDVDEALRRKRNVFE